MKTFTVRSFFAVAALAVAAVSASAQTYKAEVPVAFRVGNKLMAPGSYQFRVSGREGQPTVTVRNLVSSSNSAILQAGPGKDAPKAWREAGAPVISLSCVNGACAITQMWTGNSDSTYAFPGLKVLPADRERMASVAVTLTKGD